METNQNISTGGDTNQAGNMQDRAAQRVQQLVGQAQTQARSRIDEQKTRAAQTLSSLASTLHTSGAQLRDDQQGAAASEYVERAAEQIERVARYLENTDVNEMVGRVEDFARRQPALFIGAAFTVGLLGARFLKSSARTTANPGGDLSASGAGASTFGDREVPTRLAFEGGGDAMPDPALRGEP